MPITARVTISGRNVVAASPKSGRQYRSIPKVPTLSITAIISTADAGVACTAASGSQRCSGHSGALTAKANMKPANSALATAGDMANSPDAIASEISRKSKVPPSNAPELAVTT